MDKKSLHIFIPKKTRDRLFYHREKQSAGHEQRPWYSLMRRSCGQSWKS